MISYGRHSINEGDIDAVTKVLKSDWLTTGPLVEQFEAELEKVVGAPTVVVSSGTAALHAAYAAIGLGPGDEVITPPITFVATQATAALLGARPVFVDVKPDFPNIDPTKVEAAITAKTKAIVAVDYAGQPVDLDELRVIADKHKLFLIEDAAHSIGSSYKGRPVGSVADLTTFSFYPTKNITTGEGGAVSSRSAELLRRAREFSRQGLVRDPSRFKLPQDGPWHQEVHEFGLNYRLPDILCALGISQIRRLDEFKNARQALVNRYLMNLSEVSAIELVIDTSVTDITWHLFPVRIKNDLRKKAYEYLRGNGVGAQINYIPAFLHPAFQNDKIKKTSFPNSLSYYSETLSLPLHVELQSSDIDSICELLIQSLSE
jgi:dTDP-4-amino-4,6-dideoxygalactose transaminase